MAMIVLVGETSIEDVNLLKSTLSSLKKSSYFYLGYMETGKNDLNRDIRERKQFILLATLT